MQHPDALGKGKVRMRFRGVHVEYVVEPCLVELANGGVNLCIRAVLSAMHVLDFESEERVGDDASPCHVS